MIFLSCLLSRLYISCVLLRDCQNLYCKWACTPEYGLIAVVNKTTIIITAIRGMVGRNIIIPVDGILRVFLCLFHRYTFKLQRGYGSLQADGTYSKMIGSFLKQVSWWFIDLNLGSLMTYADPLKCIHKKRIVKEIMDTSTRQLC